MTGSVWPELAAHAGSAYLRYSFTRGTRQEVDFLWPRLGLREGSVVLDLGCGPGRHAAELRARGAVVVGVDLALPFLQEAARSQAGGLLVQADARRLPLAAGAFDAAVCLCQGGFGLLGGGPEETDVLAALARCLRPGGRLALSAFSAWYALKWLGEDEFFDPATGVLRETTTVKGPPGRAERRFALESTCFTPRELHLMLERAGLEPGEVWSVEPGAYGARPPSVDLPEWLVVARA